MYVLFYFTIYHIQVFENSSRNRTIESELIYMIRNEMAASFLLHRVPWRHQNRSLC